MSLIIPKFINQTRLTAVRPKVLPHGVEKQASFFTPVLQTSFDLARVTPEETAPELKDSKVYPETKLVVEKNLSASKPLFLNPAVLAEPVNNSMVSNVQSCRTSVSSQFYIKDESVFYDSDSPEGSPRTQTLLMPAQFEENDMDDILGELPQSFNFPALKSVSSIRRFSSMPIQFDEYDSDEDLLEQLPNSSHSSSVINESSHLRSISVPAQLQFDDEDIEKELENSFKKINLKNQPKRRLFSASTQFEDEVDARVRALSTPKCISSEDIPQLADNFCNQEDKSHEESTNKRQRRERK